MSYSIKRIASELGISPSAVSFIINGKAAEKRISPELENQVKEFCEKVNYCPNIHARRMSSRLAKNIGFLIDERMCADSENPFSDQIISEITGGVVLAAAREGFRVTIRIYNSDMHEEDVFGWLRNKEIDGLIYYGLSFNKEWMDAFLREKRCVAGIGIEPIPGVSTVNINNRELVRELAEAMIKKGRRRFLYLSGGDGYVSAQRLAGLKDALSGAGISVELNVINCNFSENTAYFEMLKANISFDAIVCANDDMALGALRALNERGISVPGEVSLSGADNIRAVRYTVPRLATLDNMNTAAGRAAFDALLKLVNGGNAQSTVLNSKIILNQSI